MTDEKSEIHKDDLKLWNTYMDCAWQAGLKIGEPEKSGPHERDCSQRANKLEEKEEHKMHVILWAAFCLEYRLKRILVNGSKVAQKVTEEDLLNSNVSLDKLLGKSGSWGFWNRFIKHPAGNDWDVDALTKLKTYRNRICHGNQKEVRELLIKLTDKDVLELYNAAIRAIRVASNVAGECQYDAVLDMLLKEGPR